MKDISMREPLTITLFAGEWAWLLGYLAALPDSSAPVVDKLYEQIMEVTD
jgi:hypothetical protein